MPGRRTASRSLPPGLTNALTDSYFTPETAIEPMGDTEYQIFKEAKSLDPPGDKTAAATFRVLTSPRVAWHSLH